MKKASKLPERFISICIVEDNRHIRMGWKSLLETVDDFLVLGDYENCELAFQSKDISGADVVLMDIGLPGMSGIEGVEYLRSNYPQIAIVMCTVHDDDQNIFDAICAGAIGYLLKKTRPQELIAAIRDAAAGGSPMTPNIARKVISSFHQQQKRSALTSSQQLSAREIEILKALAEGESYRKIAADLGLTTHGVGYHIRNIYQKLQVHSRAQAIAKGLKQRLIRPPR